MDATGAPPLPEAPADLEALSQLLKVLAHPTRLRIFGLLMQGVHCNCELSAALGLSLSLISHHLRVLRRHGLVDTRRDADDSRWIYYSINQDALRSVSSQVQRLLDASRIQPRQPRCGPRRGGATARSS
jgi:ArsR family transcriptional regulator